MLFSSITFLYYFLPCVLILYFIAPRKLKNSVLLAVSLVFYAWGEPVYVLLMAVSIAMGYICGLAVERFRGKTLSKVFLAISVAISLGFLGYFKYADFFIENFNAATGLSVKLLNIALPIGISFYTFQLISYTIDVYRGEKAQKNPINLAAYVTMFPQLIAGPIVRYADIARMLTERKHTLDAFSSGVTRFVFGLGKKILIANTLGELCDVFKASDDKSVLFYWLYAVAYALHVYFDFSGYSDMAIGLGRMFGFDFMENFNYPFISSSAAEFWRRWHISLGSWFRDYVYIPMGGNKVSKPRWFFNILTVWFLTGFWHGAAWTFIVWGLFFAALLTLEKLCLNKILKKSKLVSHIYVIIAVLVSFVIFNAASLGEAGEYIGAMFGAGKVPAVSQEFFYYFKSYALTLAIAIVGATPIVKQAVLKIKENKTGNLVVSIAQPIAVAALLVVMTAYLVDGSFNPFLYFRF